MKTVRNTRRDFLKQSIGLSAAAITAGPLGKMLALAGSRPGSKMKLGLVTYLWGRDWDLPTLIANCEKTKVLGVELRTQHAHGVESNLNPQQRRDVKKRFDDSPVELVGLGTNFAFHHADPERLKKDIEGAKQYLELSRDVFQIADVSVAYDEVDPGEEVTLYVRLRRADESDTIRAVKVKVPKAAAGQTVRLAVAGGNQVPIEQPRPGSLGDLIAQAHRRYPATSLVVALLLWLFPDYATTFLSRFFLLGSQHYPTGTVIETVKINSRPVRMTGWRPEVTKSPYGRAVQFEVTCSGRLPPSGHADLKTDRGVRTSVALTASVAPRPAQGRSHIRCGLDGHPIAQRGRTDRRLRVQPSGHHSG